MRGWSIAVALDEGSVTPRFLQIARAVADDIRRGRLRAGDALPGSRTLAASLAVHRNTVLAAYRELAAEGWIETRPAGATFVSHGAEIARPRRGAVERAAVPVRPGFDLPAGLAPYVPFTARPGMLTLDGGVPDVTLFPTRALGSAYRRALAVDPAKLLGYGDPRGDPRLRRALASMLTALRGLGATEDDVLVTRGSQGAIDLLARVLLRPGDVVAVEALGYRAAWMALARSGAELVPIAVDAGGLDVAALARLAEARPVRAIYLTPHHHYPTTVTLAPGRRAALLELARERRIALVEDDYDNEFHYDGRPVLPLASGDRAGVVIYVGTLSKITLPGLRLGFVVAPRPLLERLATERTYVDRQGDLVLERALADLLEEGEIQRHARRMRRVYQARRDALVEWLGRELPELAFDVPKGGLALWARAEGVDVEAWQQRAAARGVLFATERRFRYDDRAGSGLRLGFATLTERQIGVAVARLRAAR